MEIELSESYLHDYCGAEELALALIHAAENSLEVKLNVRPIYKNMLLFSLILFLFRQYIYRCIPSPFRVRNNSVAMMLETQGLKNIRVN